MFDIQLDKIQKRHLKAMFKGLTRFKNSLFERRPSSTLSFVAIMSLFFQTNCN